MGAISKGTLPQNFLESTSTGMRLPQPEPQYAYARLAMAGRLSLEALRVGAPTVQQFMSMMGNGAVIPPELDQMVRFADMFPGAVNAVDEFGKDGGDTVKFQRDLYPTTVTGLGEDDRQHKPETTISTTGQSVKQEEVPVVLKEFKGPWNDITSQVDPYAILSFDAKYRKNKEALASMTTRFLRRDYIRWLDRVIRNRFIADSGNSNITYPDGISAATGFITGNNAYISLDQLLRARKSLSDREWSKFPNGRFVCMVPTSFNTQMVQDVDYRELSKTHTDGRNQLFGYIGSVQDIDIFECSTNANYAPLATDSTAYKITLNGGTVPVGVNLAEALLFGPGAVGFGTAVSDQQGSIGPEVRYADDTNYGTVAKCIWYALHAFQTLDVRAVQRIVWQTA